MPGKLRYGDVRLTSSEDARPDPSGQPRRLDDEGPLRILLVGDFRGRAARGEAGAAASLAGRPLLRVDRDNLDAVLARLEPAVALHGPDEDEPVAIAFRAMDDFHPDRLLARCAPLRSLIEARRQLASPATFREAARALGLLEDRPVPPAAPPPSTPPPAPAAPPPADSGSLLDQILADTAATPDSARPARPAGPPPELAGFLAQVTAPHVVGRQDPRQDEVLAQVDEAIGALLREVLHHPDFQALEATWRAVDVLVRRLETGERLTLELLDVTRDEVEADLLNTRPIEATALSRRLVEPTVGTPDGQPFALIVGLLTFGPDRRDLGLLWRLGQLARAAGAPFVAGASPRFVGCDSLAATPDPDDWDAPPEDPAWSELRSSPEASYLGLALPRLLLRLPYGPDTDPIETLRFREFPAGTVPDHEAYLWGPPAVAVAEALGRAFAAGGPAWSAYFDPEIGDLPLPLEERDGETVTKPPAEVALTTRAAGHLLDAGLLPVLSLRDRDVVRLAQLASIADPPEALAVGPLE